MKRALGLTLCALAFSGCGLDLHGKVLSMDEDERISRAYFTISQAAEAGPGARTPDEIVRAVDEFIAILSDEQATTWVLALDAKVPLAIKRARAKLEDVPAATADVGPTFRPYTREIERLRSFGRRFGPEPREP